MLSKDKIELVTTHLGQFITEHKKLLVEDVLSKRTRHVTLVLEDIFQSQNASAVFRTAECFGIQDIHLIENINKYSLSKGVLKGANKWLSLIHHKEKEHNTKDCLVHLKGLGYKILATTPNADVSLREVDVDHKVAILFGNELHGLSEEALQLADVKVKIPMAGFTESLNLSVSAAICISELITKLKATHATWKLTDDEANELRASWYRRLVKNSDVIEREYLKSIK